MRDILWDKVRRAQYCGAPCGRNFVAAFQTVDAALTYEGPEFVDFHAREQGMFKEL